MKMKDGLLLGLLIGIGSALLYAPKTGKEVREEVKDKLDKVPRNFGNLFESLVDLSVSVLDFARESLTEQGEKFSDAVSKGVDAAREKTEELKNLAASK